MILLLGPKYNKGDINSVADTNHNKSRLLFSSAEIFKKPLRQTVWTQIRLLL